MAVRVYTDFKKQTSKRKDQPWRASVNYFVTGVASEFDVFSAVDSVTGNTIPAIGDEHPENALLKVVSVTPETYDAPEVWRVAVEYETAAANEDEEEAGGALDEPLKWRWEPTIISTQTSRDAYDRIMVNTVGIPFPETESRNIKAYRLVATRNEPFYDLAAADQYMDMVNDGALTAFGKSIGQYQLLCELIFPTSERTVSSLFETITYQFLFVPGVRPHDYRKVDRSNQGWISRYDLADDGSVSEDRLDDFYTKGGDGQPTKIEDVLLDGEGKPLNSAIKVGRELYGAATPDPPLTVYWEVENVDGGKVLVYSGKKSISFTGLLPGIF